MIKIEPYLFVFILNHRVEKLFIYNKEICLARYTENSIVPCISGIHSLFGIEFSLALIQFCILSGLGKEHLSSSFIAQVFSFLHEIEKVGFVLGN